MIACHLDRTQRSKFKASSVPQLLRSIRDELNTVLDELCFQDMLGYDREALAKVIQTRLEFTQKPIHLLTEWLDPTTYTNALKQKQHERNLADACLREIATGNVGGVS